MRTRLASGNESLAHYLHIVCAGVLTTEGIMQVAQAMSRDVRITDPDQTICEAAALMAEVDAGVIPVGKNDRLVGMITDRDIAVRAVAAHKGPDTRVSEVMTAEVKYCFEDEDLDHVAKNMADLRVRRLPVLNRAKRLVGILSLGDIALEGKHVAAEALSGVSRGGGPHSQA